MGVIQFILGMGCILGAGYLFISAYPPPTGDMSHDHLMTSPNALNEDPTYLKQAFEYFMKKYWKVYSTMDEKQERFLIFIENLRFIAKHNMNRGSGHTVGINQFGDMTHLEYSSSFLSPQGKSTGRPEIPETYDPYGADVTIDWVKAGKVTKVMNGGWKCLSDWAIAATGAVESLSAILTKKLVEFSAQQLVDCDGRNNNCAGGSVAAAYDYIKDNGIALATSYPYVGKYETCKVPLPAPAFHIGGKATIAENDNPALILHLKNQPISATIDGYAREFMFYKGGIIQHGCRETVMDHEVLIVGAGTEAEPEAQGIDYWVIKNDWGSRWGEGGFVRIERGKGVEDPGECAVSALTNYPTPAA